ncbi:uncharacterized protein EV420DRAFT_1638910 [Desarmillaria tabescens]|uniref:RING-type domain-containing protein n=1 Tax=Armillaria tabescens TaxID=1929756 RepID=A0AA39NEH1_ARMTA|nr:uncharacterized protein EV420DRAFT_1638910 [Desarmillaria tabescens]KAK0463988.1 hypothetical protein EV420DRAFT_1638910 [Desarmillaria tabescens]
MSAVSTSQPEFDFWEFVNCARCQLPFSSDAGATIPFWLTECGHIVCNNHLNADQSCTVCGSPGIQLVPLQREMEPPMSDWFRSIPYALDSIAYTAKFQQESMAAQIQYYRTRHQQQRAHIEKLKREMAELKRANQYLTGELSSYQQGVDSSQQQMYHRRDDQEPSDNMNAHGKRPMDQRPMTTPSPHSSLIGPDRLTLPPGQQPPNLSYNRTNDMAPQVVNDVRQQRQQRPASRNLAQQYVYVPPSTPHMPPPQLSHMQAPRNVQRARVNQDVSQGGLSAATPSLTKFKPAQVQGNNQPRNMGPPPTPVHARAQQRQSVNASTNVPSRQPNTGAPPSNRFLPPGERFAPPSSTNTGGRGFLPPTSTTGPQHFVSAHSASLAGSSGTRAMPRAGTAIPNTAGGGSQRMPFVPGQGFR